MSGGIDAQGVYGLVIKVVWRQTVHEYCPVVVFTKRICLQALCRPEQYEYMSYTVSCDTTGDQPPK